MKKLGFTLSEVLVALGIIGVIAAITIPMIHKVTPDKDKAIVIKTYKNIADINNRIFNDPSLYILGTNYYLTNRKCTNIMDCTEPPSDPSINSSPICNYSCIRTQKYPRLLIYNLNISEWNGSMSTHSGGTRVYFTTADGIKWTIEGTGLSNSVDEYGQFLPTESNLEYYITIDTLNSNGSDCIYNKTTCKNPRKFQFLVNKDGKVSASPNDNLTKVYLQNPLELNNRSADLKKASEL